MLQIEKVVKLMDDYHFEIFREYVKNLSLRSYYPLLLLDSIDRAIDEKKSPEKYCELIYEDDDPKADKTRKKFLQLAHYTFKLVRYLSRNYPAFLLPNINKIQRLINEGNLAKANLYSEALLDISGKIEDFNTQITVLNILALQNELQENIKEVVKLYEEQSKIIEYRQIVTQLYLYRQGQFSVKSKPKDNANIEEILGFFVPYFESESYVVSALSQYFYLHGLNFYNAQQFFDQATLERIEKVEKILENNPYLAFPYLEDLEYRVTYLKLRFLIQNFDDNRVMELSSKILENADETLFWNSFASQPEFFSIAVQASYYSSNYNSTFKEGYWKNLDTEIIDNLNNLKKRCQKILSFKSIQEVHVKHIGITNTYACLLLIGNENENKKAISLLENLLYIYQQVPFHAGIDPIFTVIISAHFNLYDYESLENSYRRYKKMTDKKSVNAENDFTIHFLFYASKWLNTQRNQYLKKLEKLIQETPENIRNIHLVNDVIEYFEIDIKL